MKSKRLSALVLAGAMLLSACATQSEAETQQAQQEEAGKLKVVTSTFHEYDWVMEILGDEAENFDVTLLMGTGVDLHSYEPSVQDITMVISADLFIYNGGHSHLWVEDITKEPLNENFVALNIIESLGDVVVDEVLVEGMQVDEHDHAHDDEHAHEEDEHAHEEDEHAHEEDEHVHEEDEHVHEEDEHTYEEDEHAHEEDEAHAAHEDEHIWLSLNNAAMACGLIGNALAEIDAENAETYATNTQTYVEKLNTLNSEYESAIANGDRDTLIFADRFPFLYMMMDYDVNYFAAFQGCSAETEASVETIMFLTDKVNELDVNTLLVLDGGLIELAETVNENSEDNDSEILVLHSMQSVTQSQVDEGATYLSIMEENLETIKIALAQ